MKIIFFIFFLSLFTNLANANDEDWIFLRCVKSSDNIKYFEVSVSREMMIERNGYQFTLIFFNNNRKEREHLQV